MKGATNAVLRTIFNLLLKYLCLNIAAVNKLQVRAFIWDCIKPQE